eukprot:m.481593 g.481593  ORF g.481593 m.481593 type:complete len:63 (+) comp57374_c0_seq1:437-625(+)
MSACNAPETVFGNGVFGTVVRKATFAPGISVPWALGGSQSLECRPRRSGISRNAHSGDVDSG